MDAKFVNVLVLGGAFMLVFTSFQTMGNIQKTILDSIHKEDNSFTGDGYMSLAIIYIAFSLSNWLAPSFISWSGPRLAMLIGSIIYLLFMLNFLWPMAWLLYTASVVLGLGASILWTGQGTFLARCSDASTISRNSGIFWALLQCSMFFGNIFVYWQFQSKEEIDKETRTLVIGVLSVVAVVGICFLAALRYVPDNSDADEEETGMAAAVYALKAAAKLVVTRDMLLLSVTFLYTGFELSFFSGVYGPSIGFTKHIAETPKEIVGLTGICIGAGEVIGGGIFGILGAKTRRFGRDPIVIIGYICHIVAFFLIFMNIPNKANFGDTDEESYFHPPLAWVALFCAFLLGFGDACYNTQIYSMLGGVFVSNSVGAFALFKFFQSVAAAIAFFYSSHVGIRVQLVILVIFATIGTPFFCIVERKAKREALDASVDLPK